MSVYAFEIHSVKSTRLRLCITYASCARDVQSLCSSSVFHQLLAFESSRIRYERQEYKDGCHPPDASTQNSCRPTMAENSLPTHYKALFRSDSGDSPLELRTIPVPSAIPGSVLLKIIYAWIPHYAVEVLNGQRGGAFTMPSQPYVAGLTAVARIVAVPDDAAVLKVGDLAVVEPTVQARDDPLKTKFLQGWWPGVTDGSRKLAGFWSTGAFAEMMLAPLESVYRVDEAALEKQGVSLQDLAFFGQFGTAYGGLRRVGLRVGETVLIAPATGTFAGGAVRVALAMGANVIAVGRRMEVLKELAAIDPSRVEVMQLEEDGSLDAAGLVDRFREVDVFCDFCPAAAVGSGITKSGLSAVKSGGRVCLVGGIPMDVPFPYGMAVLKCLTIQGSFMMLPEYARELVKLVETGRLGLGGKGGLEVRGVWKLEEWRAALDNAREESGPGKGTFFAPGGEV